MYTCICICIYIYIYIYIHIHVSIIMQAEEAMQKVHDAHKQYWAEFKDSGGTTCLRPLVYLLCSSK